MTDNKTQRVTKKELRKVTINKNGQSITKDVVEFVNDEYVVNGVTYTALEMACLLCNQAENMKSEDRLIMLPTKFGSIITLYELGRKYNYALETLFQGIHSRGILVYYEFTVPLKDSKGTTTITLTEDQVFKMVDSRVVIESNKPIKICQLDGKKQIVEPSKYRS